MKISTRAAISVIAAVVAGIITLRRHNMSVWEFTVCALLLAVCLYHLTSRREPFDQGTSDLYSVQDSVFTRLWAIPAAVQDTVTPALDGLINTVKNSSASSGEPMNPADYPSIVGDAFTTLVREYESVDHLLSSLQNYANPLYSALIQKTS